MAKVIGVMALLVGCTNVEVASSQEQAVASPPSTLWHQVQLGRDANFSYSDGLSSYYVETFEWGAGANRTAYLAFFSTTPDVSAGQTCDASGYCQYTTYVSQLAYGVIPSSDMEIAPNERSAQLHTTTGANLSGEVCIDVLTPGGTFTCSPNSPPPTTFDLVWTFNHQYEGSFSGASKLTGQGFTYITNGTTQYKSSDVNGSAFGVSLTGTGTIQDSQNVEISHDLVQGSP
jgi:hypothetical protein